MKDKYYTPEIEEFHVGFEFEVNYTDEGRDIRSIDKLKSFLGRAKWEEAYRVKYLDKEDIEDSVFKSTGGKLIKGVKDYFEYHPDSYMHYTLEYVYSTNLMRIKKEDSNYFHECEAPIFEGRIKNKSEFNKIIKQLDITNENTKKI